MKIPLVEVTESLGLQARSLLSNPKITSIPHTAIILQGTFDKPGDEAGILWALHCQG